MTEYLTIDQVIDDHNGDLLICNDCLNSDVILTRDIVSHLHFMHCKKCGTSKSLRTPIFRLVGYKGQKRFVLAVDKSGKRLDDCNT